MGIGCGISEFPSLLAGRYGIGNDVNIDWIYSSQALDVGTLKNVQADLIRILVWILSFMSFGYATAEFEVTSERLGVYRPEEHIECVLALLIGSRRLTNVPAAIPKTMRTTRMLESTTSVSDLLSVTSSWISTPTLV